MHVTLSSRYWTERSLGLEFGQLQLKIAIFEKNSSYVIGVSVCIFVALYLWMFVARANKVEGTMS